MTMNTNPYLEKELRHFFYTFKRQPLLLEKAKGSFVWDEKGKKYLDFYSGIAVCGVGHNHPNIVQAIKKQAGRLLHVSNYFYTKPQMALAKALTEKMPNSRVFFSNSGAEANEFAIKLARLWAHQHKRLGREIITFEDSFHGRTLATGAASGSKGKSKEMFSPLPAGFKTVPFNNLDDVESAITSGTIGIMVEPVQGEAGIRVAKSEFFHGLANLCLEKELLLIVDEVQSGMGRTGSFFAFEQYGIKPDIVTLAKGLAGGLPLGATLAQEHIAKFVEPGMHGSTFGGNPVSCAASLEVLKLLSPKALKSVQVSGDYLLKKLSGFKKFPFVKEIRGRGFMLAMELSVEGAPFVNLAREKGLLINCTQNNILRFLPPYFITKQELDKAVKILEIVFLEMN